MSVSLFKGPGRLEAFSDGVFAIALTLLILEIKAPSIGEHGGALPLWRGLAHLWPSYLAYLLAFVTVLMSWMGHHTIVDQVKVVDVPLLLANGFFLLTVSVLPFPTSLVAEHLLGEAGTPAAMIYAFATLLNSLSFIGLIRAVVRRNPGAAAQLSRMHRNAVVGVVWCLLSAALAIFSPLLSLLLVAALWAWWMWTSSGAA